MGCLASRRANASALPSRRRHWEPLKDSVATPMGPESSEGSRDQGPKTSPRSPVPAFGGLFPFLPEQIGLMRRSPALMINSGGRSQLFSPSLCRGRVSFHVVMEPSGFHTNVIAN